MLMLLVGHLSPTNFVNLRSNTKPKHIAKICCPCKSNNNKSISHEPNKEEEEEEDQDELVSVRLEKHPFVNLINL